MSRLFIVGTERVGRRPARRSPGGAAFDRGESARSQGCARARVGGRPDLARLRRPALLPAPLADGRADRCGRSGRLDHLRGQRLCRQRVSCLPDRPRHRDLVRDAAEPAAGDRRLGLTPGRVGVDHDQRPADTVDRRLLLVADHVHCRVDHRLRARRDGCARPTRRSCSPSRPSSSARSRRGWRSRRSGRGSRASCTTSSATASA